MDTHTFIEKEIASTGNGDLEIWRICSNDDGSIIAQTYSEHLAKVIQQAIEDDIAKNGADCGE